MTFSVRDDTETCVRGGTKDEEAANYIQSRRDRTVRRHTAAAARETVSRNFFVSFEDDIGPASGKIISRLERPSTRKRVTTPAPNCRV